MEVKEPSPKKPITRTISELSLSKVKNYELGDRLKQAGNEDEICNEEKTADQIKEEIESDFAPIVNIPNRILRPSYFDDDAELGTEEGKVARNFRKYHNKNIITQGLLDISLFTVNVHQFKHMVHYSEIYGRSLPATILITLIALSLTMQITIGVLLLISARYNVNIEEERQVAYKFGDCVLMFIYFTAAVNIFIATYGMPSVNTS